MKLVNKSDSLDKEIVKEISQESGIVPAVVKSLLNKNYSKEEVLSLTKDKDFLDPMKIPSIEKVCQRLLDAKNKNEKVFIFGDYDVDGTMATTIFYRFLNKIGVKTEHYIPERSDGYGLSETAITEIYTQEGRVVITVDTGITAFKPIDLANDLGLDVIVTDHHNIPDEGCPDALACINPKIEGMPSEIYNLSGAGVALYVCRAINQVFFEKGEISTKVDMTPYFCLAAISSIADVVPLRGENREIVKKGLRNIKKTGIMGLDALVGHCNFWKQPTAMNIAFKISPILNAASRMKQAEKTLNVLLTDDYREAKAKSAALLTLNEKRKELTEKYKPQVVEEASKQVNNKVVVLAGKYPLGIIGILAAKVMEGTGKPTIIISVDSEGKGKASCRSVKAFNIKTAIDKTVDHHLGGGGHDVAAGFSINESQIDEFIKAVNEYAKTQDFEVEEEVFYDEKIQAQELADSNLKKSLGILEPVGKDNESPRFLIEDLEIKSIRVITGGHLMMDTEFGRAMLLSLIHISEPTRRS